MFASVNALPALSPRTTRIIVCLIGAAALVGGTLGWALGARPYEAPWAWISFIGMCVLEDYLLGTPGRSSWATVPHVTLFAAIIVFRRHPEITMLMALVAAPAAAVLKGQSWAGWLTGGAQWMLAAVVGEAIFRAVGFEDRGHFVAATIALGAGFIITGPVVSAWLESRCGGAPFVPTLRRQARFSVPLEVAGALLALAWRTGATQAAALKLADGALVAVAGITVAALLRGRPAWVFKGVGRIPQNPALVAGAVLMMGLLAPRPLSWMLPLGLALIVGAWAALRGAYSILCCALGAFCNELVRGANSGFMPVEGSGLMSGLGATNTYVVAGPTTMLPWLDDRLHLPPPLPGIASAGDVLIAVGMAWLVATVAARRRPVSANAEDDDLAVDAAA